MAQTKIQFNPGVYRDLEMKRYHRSFGLSASGLKKLMITPAHYIAYLKEWEDKPEFEEPGLYELVHLAVLEPKKFEEKVEIINGRRAGKVKLEVQEALEDGILTCKSEMKDHVMKIAESIRNHPRVKELLKEGEAETSIFWEDKETGVLLKCRPDWVNFEKGYIVDLKGFYPLTPVWGLERQVYKMGYHIQSAFHLSGVASVTGTPCNMVAYVFYEDRPPYGVRVCPLQEAALELAETQFRPWLNVYATCLKENNWFSYDEDYCDISLPSYAWNEVQE